MPIFYQQRINNNTQLAIWEITEPESFFLSKVPLQKNITHPHKRLQHLAGRYLLCYLFPNFPYEEILIADTRKPYLPNEQYHFSISHCGNYAAAIVSTKQRVGIDIEIPTPKVLRVASKFLGMAEHAFFQPNSNNLPLITLLWSIKEAMFKWWGRGEVDFSEMLHITPFDMQENGQAVGIFVRETAQVELPVQYVQFPQICLAWLATETEHLFV